MFEERWGWGERGQQIKVSARKRENECIGEKNVKVNVCLDVGCWRVFGTLMSVRVGPEQQDGICPFC